MDISLLAFAFVLGFIAMQLNLPPLAGYLAAGFLLHAFNFSAGPTLDYVAEVGIQLLLFSIGLKLSLRSLLQPYVWGTATLHMMISSLVIGLVLFGLGYVFELFHTMTPQQLLLIGFAFSFSSTVFAVKIFDERGEMSTLHGKAAIGVLIMQDIFAVGFMTLSQGKYPHLHAVYLLLALWPTRWLLFRILDRVGHGELLLLFGMLLTLGGATVFDLVGIKADLGALIFGILLAGHPKANELSKQLMGFKELFLVGFFLQIGLGNSPEAWHFVVALILVVVALFKGGLFFLIFTRLRLRARTALWASLSLVNFSEFGLIVTAVGVRAGLLPEAMLIITALAVALSFVVASALNIAPQTLYERFIGIFKRCETLVRLPGDAPVQMFDANILVLGMGRVGTGVYDELVEDEDMKVLGVDSDVKKVAAHKQEGRNVVVGDATDNYFWQQLDHDKVNLVLLALPNQAENVQTIKEIKATGFTGKIAAEARYEDEIAELYAAGAHAAYNIYAEAGRGFAQSVLDTFNMRKV